MKTNDIIKIVFTLGFVALIAGCACLTEGCETSDDAGEADAG